MPSGKRKASFEAPFRSTIAHGFLTLSLLPVLVAQVYRIDGVRMGINYGLNKVRFPAPVPVPSKVRASPKLKEITDGIKAELSRLHPGEREVLLTSPFLTNPLQMQAVTSWRVDAKKLKAENPMAYALYAKQSTSLRLAPLKG